MPAHPAGFVYIIDDFTGLVDLSSPSFDSEAASQQLLAEASSPIRRHTAAPPADSIAAQRGANLLNAARALPISLVSPAGSAGALAKPGRLKSLKGMKGKLPRASLAGLIPESSQKKARGKQLYDMEPSPQKRRASSPPQITHLENEEGDIVPERSQVQPEDDAPTEIPEGLDVSAPTEAFGDDDIVDAPTSPLMPREEVLSTAKKQHGRPKNSGSSVTSAAARGIETDEVALLAPFQAEKETSSAFERPQASPRIGRETASSVTAAEKMDVEVGHSTIATPRVDAFKEPKKGRGRPRKSGESVASQPSDSGFAEANDHFRESALQEMQTQRPAAVVKPKRKARPERGIDTHPDVETGASSGPAKKVKKLKGPKMVGPDELEFEEDDALPLVVTPRQDAPGAHETSHQNTREIRRQERRQAAQAHADSPPRVELPVGSKRTRSSRTQGDPANVPAISSAPAIVRKSAAEQYTAEDTRVVVAPSVTERGKTNRQIHISFQVPRTVVESEGEAEEDAAPPTRQVPGTGRQDGSQKEADGKDGEERDYEDNDVDSRQTLEDQDAVADSAKEQIDDQNITEGPRLPALEEVFDFANRGERSEVCFVGLARKIDRSCVKARVTLSKSDCSYEDIAECKDLLVRRLASIGGTIGQDTQSDFKRDAFAHLFQALTLVLEAMYDKLQYELGQEGDVMESLSAMQVLYPFIREILRFKDTIDSWKVRVQGQRQGDRLIKSVETDLIAPLRLVEKHFKKRLNALRKVEIDQQAHIKLQRQRERQEQEMVRQEEALRSAKERRQRWQNLHIARMQCEADPYRRRWLRFVEPPDFTETDANGNSFERVPFFGKRSAPPPSSVPMTSGKDWAPEQEMALLDALQSFKCKFTNSAHSTACLPHLQLSKISSEITVGPVVSCVISRSLTSQPSWPGCDILGLNYCIFIRTGTFRNGFRRSQCFPNLLSLSATSGGLYILVAIPSGMFISTHRFYVSCSLQCFDILSSVSVWVG